MTVATPIQAEPKPDPGLAAMPDGSADDQEQTFSTDIVLVSDPGGVRAEAIRALRTYIIAQHLHEGRRALAVCAASGGVGCSFVAANLAIALSQAGVNTLLIDADLRAPSLDRLIPPSRQTSGLTQCLAGSDDKFGDYIEHDILPNLSIMYAGGVAESPQELLAGARFKSLMDFCLRDYAITIVDTPPANICADARRIGAIAGYSLIVAAKDKTFVDDIKTLTQQMQGDHARVIGAVLNEA